MTTIILLMLGAGVILIISAIENTPLAQTVQGIWAQGAILNQPASPSPVTGPGRGPTGAGSNTGSATATNAVAQQKTYTVWQQRQQRQQRAQ